MSHATIGVLHYPFEPVVPLATLDAELAAQMGAALDPTVPGAALPPLVPPASRDAIMRAIVFLREAPAAALTALLRNVLEERGLALAIGEGRHEAAERAVEEAIAHAALRDEADRWCQEVVDALQARKDEWRIPHRERDPDARLTEPQLLILHLATSAVRAKVAWHELSESDVHCLWSPLEELVRRYEERGFGG